MKSLLSHTTAARFERLAEYPKLFKPNDFTIGELGKKSIALIIGPSGTGKGYNIDKIVTDNPSFRQSCSVTTRSRRSDDTPETVRYISWINEDINDFCDAIERGDFVNYTVHPKTGEIYGTMLHDHPGEYNLMPTLTRSVADLQALPFHETPAIGITAPPEQWDSWFRTREFTSITDRKARIDEGIASTLWLLDKHDVSIVANAQDSNASATIQRLVKTGAIERDETTALALLKYMQSLQ